MVTIYTLTYNEELLINFMVNHYRERFPKCRIVVNDNMSTDKTVEIAQSLGCDIKTFDTNNEYSEGKQTELRNNCWKNSTTDWVLVCDLDELLDINESQLKAEDSLGVTVIRSVVFDMINLQNNVDISGMKYGVRGHEPGKLCLFNKKYINEMNYGPGSHTANPQGLVRYSKTAYKLYHYNSINEKVTIKKFRERDVRQSAENLENGWGIHYHMTSEEIYEEYTTERIKAIKVRD